MIDENGSLMDTINERIYVLSLPVMVGSKLCNEQVEGYGGYFIINGHKDVLFNSMVRRKNKILVYPGKDGVMAEAKIISEAKNGQFCQVVRV